MRSEATPDDAGRFAAVDGWVVVDSRGVSNPLYAREDRALEWCTSDDEVAVKAMLVDAREWERVCANQVPSEPTEAMIEAVRAELFGGPYFDDEIDPCLRNQATDVARAALRALTAPVGGATDA